MIRVLFVCLGNICRSPMAEAVFAQLVREAKLEHAIAVDSAGTSGWHVGARAHPGTLGVLARQGIAYDGRGRQLTAQDLADFDYVLVMDHDNLAATRALLREAAPRPARARVELFLAAAHAKGLAPHDHVPDPYYDGRFDDTYQLVLAGAQALLARLRAEHNF